MIAVDLTYDFKLNFGIGLSTWQVNINTGTRDLIIGFNFVALALILVINKLNKYLKDQDLQISIQNIGKSTGN